MQPSTKIPIGLILGDLFVVLFLALYGYLTHYAGVEPFSFRWMSTFLPLCLGWAMAAIPMGLYTPGTRDDWKRAFWRAGLAATLAAPFATMLRGFWLNGAVIPTFMAVLSAFGALAMLLWRAAWAWFAARSQNHA
jgi:hypothetical protein